MSKQWWDHDDLKIYPVWRHVKTGGLYHVLGVARCSTNAREGKEESVIYFSLGHQTLNYREVSEFLDGRFVPELPEDGEGNLQ